MIQITAQDLVNITPALKEANADHTATTENGRVIIDAKLLDSGQIALTIHPLEAGITPDVPQIVPPTFPVLLRLTLMDSISALNTLMTDLASARNAAQNAASALKNAEARWLMEIGKNLKDLKSATEKREKVVYEQVRAFAPIVTRATGDSKPVLGVAVENFTSWVYDAGEALKWAIRRGAKAVGIQLSPAQSPRLVSFLLDLIEYRDSRQTLDPMLAILLHRVDSFLMLDAAEYEKLLKSGMYTAEGIPGKEVTTQVAKVDSDISFHILETL